MNVHVLRAALALAAIVAAIDLFAAPLRLGIEFSNEYGWRRMRGTADTARVYHIQASSNLHELKGDHAQYLAEKEREKVKTPENHKRTSQEIKTSVETTQKMMGDTMEELKNRMTARYMGKSLVAGVKHHPGRTAIISASTGLLGFLFVRWRMHQKHAAELALLAQKSLPARWIWKLRQAHR